MPGAAGTGVATPLGAGGAGRLSSADEANASVGTDGCEKVPAVVVTSQLSAAYCESLTCTSSHQNPELVPDLVVGAPAGGTSSALVAIFGGYVRAAYGRPMNDLEPAGRVELDGNVAVVTGGGSGIGRAIVEALVVGGASVLAADLDALALEAVAEATGCATIEVDVTSEQANNDMMSAAMDRFGRLDLAFLNAGVLGRPRTSHGDPYLASDLDLDRYRAAMAVNTDAVVYGTVAATKVMAATGGGAIIATASTAGLTAWPITPFYAASKHAVVGWVRAMGESLALEGVTMNAICPGGVATPLVGRVAADAGDETRLLRPSTVAEAAIATALSGANGQAVSVVAGRDPIWQAHDFSDVPGFPGSLLAKGS